MIIQQHSSGLFLDLDGTLIDSLPGIEFSIRQAVNAVLPNSNLSDIRSYIGPPIHDIFRKLVGTQSPDVEEALLRIFREVYNGEGWRQS